MGIEEADHQPLQVGRIAVQVEVALEVAVQAPQAIGHAIVEVALGNGLCRIEAAAHQVGKFDLGGIRAARDAAGVADPDIDVGGHERLRDIHARDLVEIDAGVDHLLAPRVLARADLDQRTRRDLPRLRICHRDELQRRRFEPAAVEVADADRQVAAAVRREPQRPEQARDGVGGGIERQQEGAHRLAPAGDVGRSLAGRGLTEGRDREARRVVALHRKPRHRGLVLAEAGMEAFGEGQCLGIGAVEDHRHRRIDAAGEEAARTLLLRQVLELVGEGFVAHPRRTEHRRGRARAPQRHHHRHRIVLEHGEHDRWPAGIGGNQAGGLVALRRGLEAMEGRGQAQPLGAAPEAVGDGAAIGVVGEDHRRLFAAQRVAQVVGERRAEVAVLEARPKGRRIVGDEVALHRRDDRGEAGLGKDGAGGKRRSRERRPDDGQRIGGDDAGRSLARALLGAAVVLDVEHDAGASGGIGFLDRETHPVQERPPVGDLEEAADR